MIIMGCVTFIMETMEAFQYVPEKCDRWRPRKTECKPHALPVFGTIEAGCMLVFTAEYIVRVALVPCVPEAAWNPKPPPETRTGFKRAVSYALQPMNLVDLVAILPFWIKMLGLTKSSFGVLRIIRLARVLRMARSPAIAASVAVFARAIQASMPALSILFFFSIMARRPRPAARDASEATVAIVRRDESRRRRGRDADRPRRRRGRDADLSAETSRRRRGRDADRPQRRFASMPRPRRG